MNHKLTALSLVLFTGLAGAAQAARPTITVYDAKSLASACDEMVADTRAHAAILARLPMEKVGVDTVLKSWDAMSRDSEDVIGPISLLTYVHPDKAVRDAGEACELKVTQLETELFQNEALYQRVLSVDANDAVDIKYRQDLLNSFEDSGVTLPTKKRMRAKAIMEQLTALDQEFDRNLREIKTTISFSPLEQRGLPDSYLERAKKDSKGNIVLGFDYPDFYPFMQQAEDSKARQRYYTAFLNRGGKRNLEILDQITGLRKELADLYGLPSYADFATRHRMVGDAKTVLHFLDDVAGVVREVEARDVQDLGLVKRLYVGASADAHFYPWDKEYYLERLRKLRYDIDQEKLRSYFPTDKTIEWVLNITSDLYGLRFVPETAPVWHKDVTYYDVFDAASSQYIGGLYMDLYPREGKYGHAAAFGIRGCSTLADRTPITALVANLDRNGLTQSEVETLLHEFGHALHGILSHTRYVDESGTKVELDFVEAPSQFYEEWARRSESLQQMKEVCPDCPVMSNDLLRRLDAARRMGSGLFYGRQLLYASYDMALAGPKPQPALELWNKMEEKTPLGHAAGTEFPGTFSHIAGDYAAGYYGYMWSEVLALDMLSAFGDNLMNPKVGKRFRDSILSRGGEVQAKEMVEDFLGRPSNPKAFFAEVRGERELPAMPAAGPAPKPVKAADKTPDSTPPAKPAPDKPASEKPAADKPASDKPVPDKKNPVNKVPDKKTPDAKAPDKKETIKKDQTSAKQV